MDKYFFFFVLVGFVAQMIDGALGMGYGVISTISLLGFGVSPAAASAGVHAAKIFTGAASGVAHLKMGNVDRVLLRRLMIPGAIGGIMGALVLTQTPEKYVKPFVSIYLAILGIVIFYKAFHKVTEREVTTHIAPLALTGGFLDSAGGGWGPIVTSTLMARGHNPRVTIGSVNLAEFFVCIAQLLAILIFMGQGDWHKVSATVSIVAGLIVGGVLAAPLAAYVCRHIPAHALRIMVGALIILLSARTIYLSL